MEPDVVTCCSLISALERGGKWLLAEQLFCQMCAAAAGGGEDRALLLLRRIGSGQQSPSQRPRMSSSGTSRSFVVGSQSICGIVSFPRPRKILMVTRLERLAACCTASEGVGAARPAPATADSQCPSSVHLQLQPRTHPPIASAAASSGYAVLASTGGISACGPLTAGVLVRRSSCVSDSTALPSEVDPDSPLDRAKSLSSTDTDSPGHAEASLGILMAGMSLGQSSGSASLSISLPAELAPMWRMGCATQSFAPGARTTGSIGHQAASSHCQPAEGSSVAVVCSPHYHVQPPQTPPPPPPVHPAQNYLVRTSSRGSTMPQVRCHVLGLTAYTPQLRT